MKVEKVDPLGLGDLADLTRNDLDSLLPNDLDALSVLDSLETKDLDMELMNHQAQPTHVTQGSAVTSGNFLQVIIIKSVHINFSKC